MFGIYYISCKLNKILQTLERNCNIFKTINHETTF